MRKYLYLYLHFDITIYLFVNTINIKELNNASCIQSIIYIYYNQIWQ